MKKIILVWLISAIALTSIAQKESMISNSMSQIPKTETYGDHTHLRGKLLELIKLGKIEDLSKIYTAPGFNHFSKSIHENGEWKSTIYDLTDSQILEVITEIRKSLPSQVKLAPTNRSDLSFIDEFFDETWIYKNKNNQTCEVSAFFTNGQLTTISYIIYY
jgi:hypothetical protein